MSTIKRSISCGIRRRLCRAHSNIKPKVINYTGVLHRFLTKNFPNVNHDSVIEYADFLFTCIILFIRECGARKSWMSCVYVCLRLSHNKIRTHHEFDFRVSRVMTQTKSNGAESISHISLNRNESHKESEFSIVIESNWLWMLIWMVNKVYDALGCHSIITFEWCGSALSAKQIETWLDGLNELKCLSSSQDFAFAGCFAR